MSYESSTVVLKGGNESSGESSASPVGTMKIYAQSSVILKDSESEGKSETDSVEYKSIAIDPKEVEASFPDWLKYDRIKRELLFNLNNAFVKLRATFGFLRLEGLMNISNLISSLKDESLAVFQTIQDVNSRYKSVASEVFITTLNPEKVSKISPISGTEKQKALELIYQVVSLHSDSKERLSRDFGFSFIKILLEIIDVNSTPNLQLAAANVLTRVLDNDSQQSAFQASDGLEKVIAAFKQKKNAKEFRLKLVLIFEASIKNFTYHGEKYQKKLENAFGRKGVELILEDKLNSEAFLEFADKMY